MDEKTTKVLLVDDEVMINKMYKVKLQKEGFNVEMAQDGLEAYASILDFQPDIVLLDIMMPNMNGFETLELFNQEPTFDAKVIILSNVNNTEYMNRAKNLGAQDYIIKSNCTPQFVVDKIKAII